MLHAPMPSWVRYCIAVYVGLLMAGTLAPERHVDGRAPPSASIELQSARTGNWCSPVHAGISERVEPVPYLQTTKSESVD